MGLHPFSLASPTTDDLEGYETDTEFLKGLHQASLDTTLMNQWIQEWILGCADQNAYLAKLGQTKTDSLRYQKQVNSKSKAISAEHIDSAAYTNEEMLLIAASREIKQIINEGQSQNGTAGSRFTLSGGLVGILPIES